jgi:NAD(P)H-dependent FMN reductase
MLTVCGSLQRVSMNRAVLEVAREMVAAAATVDDFDGLAGIPAFNPDLEGRPADAVTQWRARLAAADVVLIAAPEYAGALPGALKNALDWIVGSAELYAKPVALMSAGTSGGEHARGGLVRTLTWQGAHVVASVGIAAPRTKTDERGRITDSATLEQIAALTSQLLAVPGLDATALIDLVASIVEPLGIDRGHIAPALR